MAFVASEDDNRLLAAACLLIIDSSDSEIEEAILVDDKRKRPSICATRATEGALLLLYTRIGFLFTLFTVDDCGRGIHAPK